MGRDYSFIATDRPANRTAAIVLRKGQHFEEPEYTNLFDAPLPLKRYPGDKDMSGMRFFRFKIVGYVGYNSRGGSKWLMLCDCGKYTVRSRRAIKRMTEHNGKCSRCSYLEYIKSDKYRERFLKKIKKAPR